MNINSFRELDWLTGILEGEGSFVHGPPCQPYSCQISLCMSDQDIVEKAALMMGSKVWPARPHGPNKHRHKIAFRTQVRGKNAIQLMLLLWPGMGQRRRKKIDDIVRAWSQLDRHLPV